MRSTEVRWTGDGVLTMAGEGRLVIDEQAAEQALASLEQTLCILHAYLDDLAEARSAGAGAFTAQELRQEVVDHCVAEMAEPGRLAHSLDELGKYAEALRLAARLSGEPD